MNTDNQENLHVLSESDDYTLITNGMYDIYDEYKDDNYSTVDEHKSIHMNDLQFVISQESNSQYIPFKIKRYWDGVDLTEKFIRINYINCNNELSYGKVVNVKYNSEYIIFHWLIEPDLSYIDGEIEFEIIALGNTSQGDYYLWKTRPDGKLNVIKGLSYNGVIEPTQDWYTDFQQTISGLVMQAKNYSEIAGELVDSINVDNIISTVQGYVDEKFDSVDSFEYLKVNYNDDTGVMNFYDSKNGEQLLQTITIDRLKNLKLNYSVKDGKGTVSLLNGESVITSAEIGDVNPSEEWTTNYTNTIVELITNDITESYTTAINNTKTSLESNFNSKITEVNTAISNLSTEFDEKLKNIDLSEIQSEVSSLRNDIDSFSSSISGIENSVNSSISEIRTSVADVTNKVDIMSTTVNDINDNYTSISEGLGSLESDVSDLKKRPSNTYDIEYTEENKLKWFENGEVIKEYTIQGGSGGSTQSSTITINRITKDGIITLLGDSTIIKYEFISVDATGDSTGGGTAVWKVGSTNVSTQNISQGENSFDITPYLKSGSNNVRLQITDSFGNMMSKLWSVNVLDFKIESNFDDSLFYSGDVIFRYTPYGDIEKNVVFVLDGQTICGITTSITARQLTYTITSQEHGSHHLEVYMTATVNGESIRSNSIHKSIIFVDSERTEPIIGCSVYELNVRQYESVNIPYVVYDPSNANATVQIYLNDSLISTLNVDRKTQTYNFKSKEIGKYIK